MWKEGGGGGGGTKVGVEGGGGHTKVGVEGGRGTLRSVWKEGGAH